MVFVFRFMSEMWPGLIILALIAVSIQYVLTFPSALPVWLLLLLHMWMHRDPRREISSDPLAIVGPIDGRVTKIEQVEDPYLQRVATQVSIKKNIFDLFHLRSPIEGTVQKIAIVTTELQRHQNGNYIPYAIWIQTDEHDDVILLAEGRRLMRRPRIYIHPGERVGQGQRLGYAPLGNLFSIYFPVSSKLMSAPGDIILGGNSVVAKFTHK